MKQRRSSAIHRISTVLLAMALSALSAVAMSTAPAHASSTASESVLQVDVPFMVTQNWATGRCMDDSFEHGVRAFGCNGQVWQRWDVHVKAIGVVSLQSQSTRRCLDDSSDGLVSKPCHFTTNQLWFVNSPPSGGYWMKNAVTGRCVDDSFPFGLRAYPCNDSAFQRWRNAPR